MMLKEQLKKDQIAAMKAGERLKKTVLGTLLAAIKNKELSKRGQLVSTVSDPIALDEASQLREGEVLEVIASEVKKRKDSIVQFGAGGREDLAAQEQAEMEILSGYLPAQLGEEEVKKEVQQAITALGASGPKELGKVIGAVMSKLKGRADGGLVSKLAKEALSG